ncbi:MAG TPA: OmpA family protein [Syntrophales bacterium]|nr:OmpA family protein [Syntrophales bacterium]
MYKKICFGLICVILVLSGCAQVQEASKTKTGQGAAIGAATGALAGAVIGHQSGHKGAGAVIGGLAGAAVGGAIGHQMDKQAKELSQIPNTKVVREGDRVVVTMQDKILFPVNSATLKPGAQSNLGRMAGVMSKYPDFNIVVTGHTDSTGSDGHNQALSERRAGSVKNFLIYKGIPRERITAAGLGESMPVASNATTKGREQNRRVELEIRPKA